MKVVCSKPYIYIHIHTYIYILENANPNQQILCNAKIKEEERITEQNGAK